MESTKHLHPRSSMKHLHPRSSTPRGRDAESGAHSHGYASTGSAVSTFFVVFFGATTCQSWSASPFAASIAA